MPGRVARAARDAEPAGDPWMRLAQPGLTFHPGRVAGRFMIVDSLRGYVPETGHDHEGSTPERALAKVATGRAVDGPPVAV